MKITLQIISVIIIIAGLIPLIKKDHWTYRIFEFPRFQKLCISLGILAIWITGFSNYEKMDILVIVGLAALSLFLTYRIFPYTPFGKKMIQDAEGEYDNSIGILVANVYQDNENFEKVISLVKKVDPDFFLLVETDPKWAEAISVFKETYPNYIEIPYENTYGMLFYSKLPVINKAVKFLIEHDVPSLEVDLELPDGNILRVYAIHPTPPIPGENVRSTERDAEILLIGKKAKEYGRPCVVIGDLNDVAWSYTTKLFLKTSELLDPRRGRGMFNTFHAKYPLLRWPLDHIFISNHFTLKDIEVHDHIGSDHFPISTSIILDPQNLNDQKTADEDDKDEAEEKIINGKTGQER